VITGAVLSEERRYRYRLNRIWDAEKPAALFIGLNPSTADEYTDDPTIRRCMSYAKAWNYGGIVMANLFAYRATDPRMMLRQEDPEGRLNEQYLDAAIEDTWVTVCCWGSERQPAVHAQADRLRHRHGDLTYLRLNKDGSPAHPLYLPGNLKPIPWEIAGPPA